MSYNFMKTYLLSQQTPLIHFQYDQEGATLRATEVKPKLDQYLIQHAHISPDAPFRLKVGKDFTNALDYKLRFSCEDRELVDLDEKVGKKKLYDIYYGDMGKKIEEKIKGVKAKKNITCTIICVHEELRKLISQHISDFFIVTNFGRMQRKGFGSFLVVQDDQGRSVSTPTPKKIAQLLCEEYNSRACYSMPGDDFPFRRIKVLYGLMKSGYNFGVYQKSMLFRYMADHGFQNEKHGLKVKRLAPKIYKYKPHYNPDKIIDNIKRIYHPKHRHSFEESANSTFYFVRALLGLADHIEYKGQYNLEKGLDYRIVRQNGTILEPTWNTEMKIDIQPHNSDIERLKSPIFFKIIDNTIYYVGEPLKSEILGKTFEFSSFWNDMTGKDERPKDKKEEEKKKGEKKREVFRVPTAEELAEHQLDSNTMIDDFLEYVYQHRSDSFAGVDDLNGMDRMLKRFDKEGALQR